MNGIKKEVRVIRRKSLVQVVFLSCLLEGAIVFGVAIGFLTEGWVRVAGVSVAAASLLGLAAMAHSVARRL